MNAHPTFPIKNVARLVELLRVASEYGWGHYVERLRLKGYLPKGDIGQATVTGDAQRLRMALERLGPTFVKFGQLLSTRRDLFSAQIIQELEKLHDAVPPFPTEQAHKIIEEELGKSTEQLFSSFDKTPLAAASIAQVHTAKLTDGTTVIVKVQRPNIEEIIHSDLNILFYLAYLLNEYVEESRSFDVPTLVEEFAQTIQKELDFRLEGRSAEHFSRNFSGNPDVAVPKVFWDLSTRRVLTMQFSAGHKIALDYPKEPEQRKQSANKAVQLFFAQVFEHGFFHGDPHAGNVFITENGQFCFHDFGIAGTLNHHDQENLKHLVLSVVTRDAEWVADVCFTMGVTSSDIDRAAFIHDLDQALERYYEASMQASSFGEFLQQFMRLGHQYHIRFPRQFLLVAKAFMVVESFARCLDPAFNMLTSLREYTAKILRSELVPYSGLAQVFTKGYRAASLLRTALFELPGSLLKAIRLMQKGEIRLDIHHEHLDDLQQHIDRASNRISFSLVIAALIIGSSLVMSFDAGPHYQGFPILGLAGFILANILGLWWVIGILRSGKL